MGVLHFFFHMLSLCNFLLWVNRRGACITYNSKLPIISYSIKISNGIFDTIYYSKSIYIFLSWCFCPKYPIICSHVYCYSIISLPPPPEAFGQVQNSVVHGPKDHSGLKTAPQLAIQSDAINMHEKRMVAQRCEPNHLAHVWLACAPPFCTNLGPSPSLMSHLCNLCSNNNNLHPTCPHSNLNYPNTQTWDQTLSQMWASEQQNRVGVSQPVGASHNHSSHLKDLGIN